MEIWKKVTKKTKEFQGYKCEECGQIDQCAIITISFGFGSDLDGTTYHFCDEAHAIKFLTFELRKKNPRIDFLYGVTKKEKK